MKEFRPAVAIINKPNSNIDSQVLDVSAHYFQFLPKFVRKQIGLYYAFV